jgi:hypothetical protein
MLDRQASTALPQRLLRSALAMPAVFWYSVAGVLGCGMVATLAWLAHDSGASAAADTALAGSIAPGGARVAKVAGVLPAADPDSTSASVTAHMPAHLPAQLPAQVIAQVPAQVIAQLPAQLPAHVPTAVPAAAPVSDPALKAGATIVNVAPAVQAEPALQAAPAALAAVAHAPAPAAALPQRQQPGRVTPRELQRDPQRLAAHSATARTALPRTPQQGKPTAAGARSAPLAHAERPATARSRRHGASAKPVAAAPAPDTDVALISAIIQHAATRQETEEAACADRACGPRMPAKP